MWNLNQTQNLHFSATKLNCKAGECKWTVYVQVFGFEIVTMCLTSYSNLNVADQGVIHLPDGRLSWHKNGCTMLESADLSALLRRALSNSADGLQLLIFWQTVQCDSQSALVIGKSCSKTLWHSIRSKSHQN